MLASSAFIAACGLISIRSNSSASQACARPSSSRWLRKNRAPLAAGLIAALVAAAATPAMADAVTIAMDREVAARTYQPAARDADGFCDARIRAYRYAPATDDVWTAARSAVPGQTRRHLRSAPASALTLRFLPLDPDRFLLHPWRPNDQDRFSHPRGLRLSAPLRNFTTCATIACGRADLSPGDRAHTAIKMEEIMSTPTQIELGRPHI